MLQKTIYATFCFLATISVAQAQSEPPRFSFEFGGGFNPPIGNLDNRLYTGWNLNTGGGINITPHLGLMGEFMFTDSGLTSSYLQSVSEPNGNFHMWGITADPTYRFNPRGRLDFYLIGGGGIYQRTVEFTRPTVATVTVFDPFFGIFYPAGVPADVVIGSLTATRPGLNGGGGFSFRLGSGNAKFFAEARYHRMFTKGISTSVLPVTFGFRW